MNLDSEAAIIINDLHNMVYRIEALQAHPRYTDALDNVKKAMLAMSEGRTEIHRDTQKYKYHTPTT